MKREWVGAGIVVAGLAMLASGQGLPPGPTPTPTVATVNVGPAVAAKAANPVPSPAAKNQAQKTTIGTAAVSVKASEPSAYWTDLVDIDADGVEEDNQFLFDKKRGIFHVQARRLQVRGRNFAKWRCIDGDLRARES